MKKHTITTYNFYSFRHNIFASGVNYMGGARQVFVRKVFVLNSFMCLLGFLGGLDGKESTRNVGDLDLIPGWGRPLGGGMGTTPVFLPGEFHGQVSLAGSSPWGCKESDMTECTQHSV